MRHPPEDSRGNPRVEVGTVAGRPVGKKMHAAEYLLEVARTGRCEVFGEQLLEAARAASEKRFHD